MTYLSAFPNFDYEIPNLGEGWEDNSWKNDACPSMDYPLAGEEIIRIWFDYKDPEMREIEGKRFILAKGIYGESLDPLLESDNLDEILAFIESNNLKGN